MNKFSPNSIAEPFFAYFNARLRISVKMKGNQILGFTHINRSAVKKIHSTHTHTHARRAVQVRRSNILLSECGWMILQFFFCFFLSNRYCIDYRSAHCYCCSYSIQSTTMMTTHGTHSQSHRTSYDELIFNCVREWIFNSSHTHTALGIIRTVRRMTVMIHQRRRKCRRVRKRKKESEI